METDRGEQGEESFADLFGLALRPGPAGWRMMAITTPGLSTRHYEDVEHIRKLVDEALHLLPTGHFLREVLLLSLGSAYWLEGDLLSASTILTEIHPLLWNRES